MVSKIAEIFTTGRSQAVRLPAEFRFEANEVFVRRDPKTGDVILSRKPHSWDGLLALYGMDHVPDDFTGRGRSELSRCRIAIRSRAGWNDPAMSSRATGIGNLEKRGAITRRAHASHGRIRQIAVTPAGRRLLAACRERVHATEDSLAKGFNADEQALNRRLLSATAVLLPTIIEIQSTRRHTWLLGACRG